ncbi:MAG: hypothetical protein BMS9Abin23_1020 [Thermodesulfobacteriota bacterium]|nr:MAG: hypothetical protein BMS9Abin23_1020 [Thermodesulfobacteriota bacterium]
MNLRSKSALRSFTLILVGVLAMSFTFTDGNALASRKHRKRGERGERGERVIVSRPIPRKHRKRGGRVIISRPILRPGQFARRLPKRRHRVVVRDREYFYRRGLFYYRRPRGFVVVGPPIGTIVASLGVRYKRIWVGGALYYYYSSIFYRRVPRGFVVVEPPATATVLLAPPAIVEPAEPATGSVLVTSARLNVRTGPDLYNPVIYQVLEDEVLIIRGKAPGWLYVELPNGKYGWVMEQYTDSIFPPASG